MYCGQSTIFLAISINVVRTWCMFTGDLPPSTAYGQVNCGLMSGVAVQTEDNKQEEMLGFGLEPTHA